MKSTLKRTTPFLVGVTGGIGSGKSTLCRFLGEMGCALFESDLVAKELQLHDREVMEGITSLFGAGVYLRDAEGNVVLDRKTIAATVFSSSEKREALNRLIHPKVGEAFYRAVGEAEIRGITIVVKEAAILFESGGERGLDAVVVVAAEMQERIRRAVLKGIGTPAEIQHRIAAQWSQERLIARADYVLFNNGTREELKKESERLYRQLLVAASSACSDS